MQFPKNITQPANNITPSTSTTTCDFVKASFRTFLNIYNEMSFLLLLDCCCLCLCDKL